jgi:hypothetical protein
MDASRYWMVNQVRETYADTAHHIQRNFGKLGVANGVEAFKDILLGKILPEYIDLFQTW